MENRDSRGLVGSRPVAEIGVDDLNGLWGPAQRLGVLGEGILEPEAFLMAQGLVRGRLANIDDGFAGQMLGCDDLGAVHGSPPGRWPRTRRGCGPGVRD